MISTLLEPAQQSATLTHYHRTIHIDTIEPLQFIDITDDIRALVASSGIAFGFVNVQTKHTTTAVIINEHEPLLLEDMKQMLKRLAPQDLDYRHNDFTIRTANLTPEENENGHSHCRALLLHSSETINICDQQLQLGRWQRIFFIELDRARPRDITVMVMGLSK